ncbi:MAG TPA: cytochrome c [Pyrinomonadaceae bacterium]
MSRSERQLAVGSRQLAVSRKRRTAIYCLLLIVNCLLLLGCRQDMQDQPRYKPLRASTFFKDGLSARTPPEGTVARGYLRADKELFTGQSNSATGGANNQAQGGTTVPNNSNAPGGGANMQTTGGNSNNTGAPQSKQNPQAGTAAAAAGEANDAEDFPFPVTQEVLERGRERFQIFCSVCHGLTGEGDGMIVRRGFRKPPSYHEPRLQQARVGYFFRVMTEGFGAMPSYRAQVPVQDRWAIAAYIRALQLSFMNQAQGAQPTTATTAPEHANTEGGGHE